MLFGYKNRLIPGIKAKMLLDMSTDVPSIYVNTWYYRLSKYRFENIWPPGQHLSNLITFSGNIFILPIKFILMSLILVSPFNLINSSLNKFIR